MDDLWIVGGCLSLEVEGSSFIFIWVGYMKGVWRGHAIDIQPICVVILTLDSIPIVW